MKYVEVSGIKVSAIGLGTWQFGSKEWGYGLEYAEKTSLDLVLRAIELGVNLIDTAEFYGFGKSESVLGNALSGIREKAFLATKLFPIVPLSGNVVSRAKASAARLETGRIDLYQLHFPNPIVPISETAKGLQTLLDDGLVDNVGVSNFSLSQWLKAEAALGRPVISNQVHFSLITRGPETDIVPFAQANDRLVIAYSPLEQGILSGKYSAQHRPSGIRRGRRLFYPANLDRLRPLIEKLAQVAKSHDATSAQVSLAWLIAKPNVAAIPGASSVAQLESNIQACEIELTRDEIDSLDELSSQFSPVSPSSLLTDFRSFLHRR